MYEAKPNLGKKKMHDQSLRDKKASIRQTTWRNQLKIAVMVDYPL